MWWRLLKYYRIIQKSLFHAHPKQHESSPKYQMSWAARGFLLPGHAKNTKAPQGAEVPEGRKDAMPALVNESDTDSDDDAAVSESSGADSDDELYANSTVFLGGMNEPPKFPRAQGYTEMMINNDPIFFAGMNRAPAELNPAFEIERRVAFNTAVQFERTDDASQSWAVVVKGDNP